MSAPPRAYAPGEIRPEARLIMLDGTRVIKVTQGPYLLGYFPSSTAVAAHMGDEGMARLRLKG